ncbi:MAG: LacI family DNA-binding transcriptional regulator [Candidatus Zixiibacteriota bacterium]|nr:MAG: LacI family DNA-binding transcriptional regulator [candidate division Zixibacteria bacterium]
MQRFTSNQNYSRKIYFNVSKEKRKLVSIKDIAQKAGVSPSTVSRALHNHPHISTETGERVQRLAHEMGYTPSLVARSLVTQDTATIGLVITYTSDPFLSRMVQGVEETSRSNGYSVFLSSSYRDYERELEVVRSFHERRTSGIIVTGSRIDMDYLDLENHYPLPIVLINCRRYPYSVSADKISGAKQAVEHLVQLGHRRIAFVSNTKFSTDLDRQTGYQHVLSKHDIPIDGTLIVEGDGKLESGIRAGKKLLNLPQPPTAIFCFNDMTALGVLTALREEGLQVPRDCSVVGFDDLEMSAYLNPPLTTVRQPCYRMGQAAIRMLLQLIRGESDVQAEVLPTELIVRQTTGLAPEPS